jgi:hypothetical protein
MPARNFLPEGDFLPLKITIGKNIRTAIPATNNKAMVVSINPPVNKIYGVDVNLALRERKKRLNVLLGAVRKV